MSVVINNDLLTTRIAQLMTHAQMLLPEHERTPYKLAEIQEWIIGWLRAPLFGQGGRRPLEAIRTEEGLQEMKDMLSRMAYGVYS